MIAQAEGLKFGIEHFRRRKPHCSGTLFWQLNDCWPVLSWSVIDYYGFGKAGYFYTQRVFAPVLASFKEEPEGGLSLWVTNDTLSEFDELLTVNAGRFSGERLSEQQIKVTVPPNASREVKRWTADELDLALGAVVGLDLAEVYLTVRSESGRFPTNRHFFRAIKDLKREAAVPEVAVRAVNEHEVEVVVSAAAYVYFFHLTHPNEFTRFEDNYFDLEPGEKRLIRVRNEQVELRPEDLSAAWR